MVVNEVFLTEVFEMNKDVKFCLLACFFEQGEAPIIQIDVNDLFTFT